MSLRAGQVVATVVLLVVWLLSDVVSAQIVTNITPTTTTPLDLGTNVGTIGSTTQITGGTRPGSGTNLFHSFDAFTLGTGDTAHFLNDMQLPTTNIFGRVIGGEVSTIDGTLRTNNPLNAADPMNFGEANLWLVNPSGLLLGPNARVEVGGSVSMSTADYLRFDGTAALFDMLSSPASLGPLSVAPVVAFGFLGPPPAPITVQGSMLEVPEGQALALVGGDITVQAGTLGDGTNQAASLRASGGQMNLVSVASPGEVLVPSFQTGPNIDGASFTSFGSVSLAPGSTINVSGTSTVSISGGQLVLSVIDAVFTTSQTPGPPETISLSPGSTIVTSNSGTDPGADVQLIASHVEMDGASILSATMGDGPGGNIKLNVGSLLAQRAAQITSSSVGAATGRAGSITVQGFSGAGSSAQSVSLTGADTSITSDTDNTGRGGDIQIRAGQVQLTDLASLRAETSGTGRAGNIGVTSDNLSVAGGARIEASTAGVGRAGDITITNTGTVSVTGLSSNGLTRSGIFAKTQTSGGTAGGGSGGGGGGSGGGGGGGGAGGGAGGGGQTSTAGNAGNIAITTNKLLLSGGAQLDSSTTTSGSGGSLFVNAEAITITGTSTSLKSDTRGNGTGGDITLAARTIGIHDKASVTAATGGSGNAGNISMTASENFTLDSAAIITTSTRGSGRGGTILINSPRVLLDGLGTSILADTLRPFADVSVTLSILHPTDGDLTVRLDSPGGTRIALLSRVGGSGDNFTGTIFDDQATQPIASGSAPFTGTFKPREPLAQLIDQTVAGTWKLNVSDQVAGNTESPQNLQSWSLRVGDQVFQSANVPRNIPDNGSVSSNLVVAAPAGAVIQGVGEAPGVGGDVTINGSTVTVQNGATLSATTRGSGQGGTVNVNATGQVALAGQGTGLFTNSEASGGSGNINVAASRMTMDNGAKVSAGSSGTGDAGSITINAGREFLSTNSSVTTDATQASGGNITLVASDMIRLRNSQLSASVFGEAQTAGGNITIDPQFVILQSSQIIAQAKAGSGGAINVIAGVFLADPNSVVSASSQQGPQGTVNIQSPVQIIGGRLTPLSKQFSSAAALLLAQRCAARAAHGKFSTFVVVGREGLPVEPGGFLASPSWTSELLGSSPSGRGLHIQFPSVTGAFPEHDARPIQLTKFEDSCH